MSLVFNNCLGSSGLSSGGAVLRVTAPAGSTVTVSKGVISKTLQGWPSSTLLSNWEYYTSIPSSQFDSSNACTVTATLNSDTATTSILITAAYAYGVILSYWNGVLYDAGDENTAHTGGFEIFAPAWVGQTTAGYNPVGCTKNANDLTIAFSSFADQWYNGAWGTINQIDLSNFTTLHIRTIAASVSATGTKFCAFGVQQATKHTQITNDGSLSPSAAEPCVTLSAGDNTLDISSINEGYIWFGASSRNSTSGGGSANVVVTKIWLT